MFAKAFELHGKIDVVLANAGITETEDIFVDRLDKDGITLAEPRFPVLDVCLKGVIYSRFIIRNVIIPSISQS